MFGKKIEVFEIKIKKATLYIKTEDSNLTLDEMEKSVKSIAKKPKNVSVKLVEISENKYDKLQEA